MALQKDTKICREASEKAECSKSHPNMFSKIAFWRTSKESKENI